MLTVQRLNERALAYSASTFVFMRKWSHTSFPVNGKSAPPLYRNLLSHPLIRASRHLRYLHQVSSSTKSRPQRINYGIPKPQGPVLRPKFRSRPKKEIDSAADGVDVVENTSVKPQNAFPRRITPSDELLEELRWIAHNDPHPKAIHNILTLLIHDRHIKPDGPYYEVMLLSNCIPGHGSVEQIREILQEMEQENIPIGAPIYFAVLKALAVHPDSQLRNTVLQRMKNEWISITAEALHHVAAGLIREGQLELAQLEMDKMQSDGVMVQKWLYILLIHALCNVKDLDAVLKLSYQLHDARVELPSTTWSQVLEIASDQHHLELIVWIWQGLVEVMSILPSKNVCKNVLNIAAERNLSWLAESAMDIMDTQEMSISNEDRDNLKKSYLNTQDSDGSAHHHRQNLWSFFRKADGLESARFDPRIALSKKPWQFHGPGWKG